MPVNTHIGDGLIDPAGARGRDGHHPCHLLDLELLTGPAQRFAKRTHRWQGRRTKSGGTVAAAGTAPAPRTTAATPLASPAAGRSRSSRGSVPRVCHLALDDAQRVIAVRLIQLPASGEIHAGWGCQR